MPTPPASQYGRGPTPPEPQVQTPTYWVERTFPTGTTFEETHLEAKVFVTTPAVVHAKLGRTINLGNYESVRVEVGVSLPCYGEEVHAGISAATQLCGTVLQQEEADVRTHFGLPAAA